MTTLHSSKIDIIVQSKYPEVLKMFKDGLSETTKGFTDLRLHEITGEKYGAKEINKILKPEVVLKGRQYVGIFNDDLWFAEGWLEDALQLLQKYDCVSPGYTETNNKDHFKKLVEETKHEVGAIDLLYGANYILNVDLFTKIGYFDERFDWSCDDLDIAWRIHLNGLKSVTSKRITMAHMRYLTLEKNSKGRNAFGVKNKELFYDKHGYRSYRNLRSMYLATHQHFRQYDYYS